MPQREVQLRLAVQRQGGPRVEGRQHISLPLGCERVEGQNAGMSGDKSGSRHACRLLAGFGAGTTAPALALQAGQQNGTSRGP